MRIATSVQMKCIEKKANEMGLSYEQMMENAGQTAADFIIHHFHSLPDMDTLIFAGRGNNGGDGFVVARKLAQTGAKVRVILVDGEPKTTDSLKNYQCMQQYAIEILEMQKDEKLITKYAQDADLIVDAIYGTGFHGFLRQNAGKAAALINASKAVVIALDLPSGINSDNGELDVQAVRADFTIAFDSHKPAHFIYPAAEFCGNIVCKDIGIDNSNQEGIEENFFIIDEEMVFRAIPQRAVNSHKGTFGKLLNISSSLGMAGAAKLSVMGAHRVGTGLVLLGAPKSLIPTLGSALTETVLLPFKETEEGTVSEECIPQIREKLPEVSACMVGCGLSVNRDTSAVVRQLIKDAHCPLLVDADGLNIISKDVSILLGHTAPLVLTPHPTEMARLIGCSTEELISHKLEFGRDFAQKYQLVLVLKGSNTLIFTPDGDTYINTTGNSGLAKGGSGDILAGMIAGFLAQGIPAALSAVCGVYLHGKAADLCAKRLSQTAMLPSDILSDLCKIFLMNNR